ncbi:MAG: hypothetical protein OXN94_07465 [Chloroflexota bacterium]|nr:hypothetical protein [Chloroflexota bacterium]
MATTEHTINDAIAELLRKTRYAWRDSNVVRSESTQLLAGSPGSQPDILIAEPHTAPVVIESEVLPAVTVEADALAKLGEDLSGSGRTILSSIAVRLPQRFRGAQGRALTKAIESANDLDFALFTVKNDEEHSRLPESGWLSGSITDLSLLVQAATIPPFLIDEAANLLEIGVNQAAGLLEEYATSHPGAIQRIADQLQQQDSIQTRRMATAILANAFMFHENLAGGPGALAEVRRLDELRNPLIGFSKPEVLDEWEKILEVNYWPIFDIARRILAIIPTLGSAELIGQLARTAQALVARNLMRSHDLTGTVFQRLIADRKFLAAFYTMPASAALLVGLAVSGETLLSEGDWSNPEDVKSLRVADFACGTGTLLSTAYQRISQIHEFHGGDTASVHPHMMERALVGCDILPAATHLTASMLSGAHPQITYDGSAIFTQPYGLQDDGKIALGSIDLLREMALLEGSQITAKALESSGEAEKDTWRFVPHGSFDLVIMNPPFVRANNHERRIPDTPNPNFAAFGATADEQKAMAKAAKELTKGTVHHGSAGEASTFLALADRKLRIDGMLALVMPVTLLSGSSWEKCRTQLASAYDGLILISIAGTTSAELSFSADTGMGDCLVIGQRTGRRQTRATFVILKEKPDYPLHGMTVARQIRQLIIDNAIRRLEDGPTGGSIIEFGDDIVGYAIDAPLPSSGGWKLARIVDLSLAQSSYQLATEKRLWLPTQVEAHALALQMTTVGAIGKIGPYHLQVSRGYSDGTRRPFELRQLQGNEVPTYPVLSAHDADRERTMMFEADHDGIPYRPKTQAKRTLADKEIANVFATASHCHSNLDFRFNSQSTAMQFTSRKTIGGRAWISIQLPTPEHEKVLVLWANTLVGILMFWWHSSRQQPGRGILTKTTLRTLPTLDVTALDDTQLQQAAQIFDETCQLPLKPVHELGIDENRKTLDRRFYGEVLGLPDSILADGGPLDILRQKLCREPSIRGSKP